MSQEIVTSKDGTRIACFRSEEGPPLVLIHGTAADHGRWRPVLYMRAQPVWQARVDAAHTIPRELRAVKDYALDPERFRDLGVPTLLLSGGDSPAALKKAGEAVDETLPDSRMVVMPGQGHAAMDTGTDLFTTEVLRFLTSQ
jgi:pimeloyl-ACP methyl ester carboxylesterase